MNAADGNIQPNQYPPAAAIYHPVWPPGPPSSYNPQYYYPPHPHSYPHPSSQNYCYPPHPSPLHNNNNNNPHHMNNYNNNNNNYYYNNNNRKIMHQTGRQEGRSGDAETNRASGDNDITQMIAQMSLSDAAVLNQHKMLLTPNACRLISKKLMLFNKSDSTTNNKDVNDDQNVEISTALPAVVQLSDNSGTKRRLGVDDINNPVLPIVSVSAQTPSTQTRDTTKHQCKIKKARQAANEEVTINNIDEAFDMDYDMLDKNDNNNNNIENETMHISYNNENETMHISDENKTMHISDKNETIHMNETHCDDDGDGTCNYDGSSCCSDDSDLVEYGFTSFKPHDHNNDPTPVHQDTDTDSPNKNDTYTQYYPKDSRLSKCHGQTDDPSIPLLVNNEEEKLKSMIFNVCDMAQLGAIETIAKLNSMGGRELTNTSYGTVKQRINRVDMAMVSQQSCSANAEKMGKLLIKGVTDGESAEVICNSILNAIKRDPQYKIKSVPIRDGKQPTSSGASQPPLAVIGTRGSEDTNNDTTTQVINCTKALQVFVNLGLLPADTEVCSSVFAALETNRRDTHQSVAFHQYLELLLNVDPKRMVIYTTDAILRIGLPPVLVKTLLLVMKNIHPNIKVLPVKDFALHPLEVANVNIEESESYTSITAQYGSNRNPGQHFIPIHDNDKEKMEHIHREAPSTKSKWCDLESLPSQIQQGINRGAKLHPSVYRLNTRQCMKSVLGTLTSVDDQLPLYEQPSVEEEMKNELATNMLLTSSNKNTMEKHFVVIYIRSSPGLSSKKVSDVAREQLAWCYEAGVAYELIDNDTELIIIFDDEKSRTNILNPGLERALAYIREGQVSAFITDTTVRVTASRVNFMFVDAVCAQHGTKLILASQSTEMKMEYAEAEHQRQIALSNRQKTRTLARTAMRNKLAPAAKHLSELLDYETHLDPSKHLFPKDLEQAQNAKEARRLEAKVRREEARSVKEDQRLEKAIKAQREFMSKIALEVAQMPACEKEAEGKRVRQIEAQRKARLNELMSRSSRKDNLQQNKEKQNASRVEIEQNEKDEYGTDTTNLQQNKEKQHAKETKKMANKVDEKKCKGCGAHSKAQFAQNQWRQRFDHKFELVCRSCRERAVMEKYSLG